MSTYRLDKLFAPHSVAVIGASPRERSVGRAIVRNLRSFQGAVHLVNPRYHDIDGIRTVKSYQKLETVPDLAVVAVPPAMVPETVAAIADKGTPGAVIVSAGLGHGAGSFAERCAAIARAKGLRLVGPNCLGLLVPRANLNASFTASNPRAGDLALISQSGAIAAGLVEWAATHGVGFSAVVSIGDAIDVDFGDLLDYFALDRATRAILLYVESIRDARKFMSAARAAARGKPVIVIKAGRHAQGAKAAATHTGALAGSDAVYDAAFRRAGLLRVFDLDELFAAAETLGRLGAFAGRRLAILTNGGGIGVLAVDRLTDLGGDLADISPATMITLDAVMPPIWSHANPIDIAGDADEARYSTAMDALLDDRANDAVLVMNVPTALASSADAAAAIAAVTKQHRDKRSPGKPVLAVWVGGSAAATETFNAAGIASYPTEADAVTGFMHVVRYRHALSLLMAAPPSLPQDFVPDTSAARAVIAAALRDGRHWLDPIEAARLFSAYGIAVTPAQLADDPDEAAAAAKPYFAAGQAVTVKILSPDIVHKSEIGGVALNLTTEQAVREAAADILHRARGAAAGAHLGRDDFADDHQAEGARIDRRRRRRSDLRSGHRVRPRRHRRRGHRRQGARAAAARSRPRPRPDGAHAGVAHSQGLSQRAGGGRAGGGAHAGEARPARRRFSGNPRDRSQSGAGRRDRRHRGRCARVDRAGRRGRPRRLRPSALRHQALSEGVGAPRQAAGWAADLRSSGPAGGRAALPAVFVRGDARRSAAALLRPCQGLQPRLHRAFHPDRLRAGDGVSRARRGDRRDARRRAPARQHRARPRGIRRAGPLRPQGPRARLAVDADDHRIRAQGGHRHDRRPGAARERHDAQDVPRPRLRGQRRSAGSGPGGGEASAVSRAVTRIDAARARFSAANAVQRALCGDAIHRKVWKLSRPSASIAGVATVATDRAAHARSVASRNFRRHNKGAKTKDNRRGSRYYVAAGRGGVDTTFFMIELKRFIRPGLAISVLGHLGIVVLGLLFAAASGLMPSPPEPTTPVLPDATVVEIVPPNEAPRFEGPTPSEARTSGSQSPLNSTNASAAPQPSRKPTAQQQLQQQPQQPQPQQQQQRAQQQLQQQPQQPQPQQQQQRAQQQRQQQAPAKSPQPDTRPAKAPPPPPPPETAHAETAPPDPAHTETAEPDIAPPDTAQPDVKQTSAPPPPPAPSPFNETADQPPTAETFALLALAGGQLGGGFAAPAVGTNQASDDFTLAFRERVSSCSSLPAGVDRHDKIEVSLRVSFKPDGTLASLPRPLGPITSAKAQAILESSIEALQKCQPYTMLPAAAYKHWKTLDLTFYPLNFGG